MFLSLCTCIGESGRDESPSRCRQPRRSSKRLSLPCSICLVSRLSGPSQWGEFITAFPSATTIGEDVPRRDRHDLSSCIIQSRLTTAVLLAPHVRAHAEWVRCRPACFRTFIIMIAYSNLRIEYLSRIPLLDFKLRVHIVKKHRGDDLTSKRQWRSVSPAPLSSDSGGRSWDVHCEALKLTRGSI